MSGPKVPVPKVQGLHSKFVLFFDQKSPLEYFNITGLPVLTSVIFSTVGISKFIKNSKTGCSTHLHPNDSANLYSNPGNSKKKISSHAYPFLDYPFLMHGKS